MPEKPEVAASENFGNTEVFSKTHTSGQRHAVNYTMPEDGTITSITMYHEAGDGMMLFGLYEDDGQGKPGILLGISAEMDVRNFAGWQTVDLTAPIFVPGGTTVWIAWVYENNIGIRYQPGSSGRTNSYANASWRAGMPADYGPCFIFNYSYSVSGHSRELFVFCAVYIRSNHAFSFSSAIVFRFLV
jgi:hypothetical protein